MPNDTAQDRPNAEKGRVNERETEDGQFNLNRRSVLRLTGATAGAAAGGLGTAALSSEPTRAASVGEEHAIDDFEDGDPSEYSFDMGASGANLVTSPTYDGSYALEISGTDTEMISMEGLEQYPSAGDVFSYRVRLTGGADETNFTYGVQNGLNRYFVRLDPVKNDFDLYRLEDGNITHIDGNSPNVQEDTWYRITISWKTDGTHTLTLRDSSGTELSQFTGVDSTWQAGGIGFDAYTADGSTVYYDGVTLDSGREIRNSNQVVDSFEDGNLSEYSFNRGQAGANIVSNPIWGGSSALELSGTNTEMISMEGLDYYPSAGDVFSYSIRMTNGAEETNFTYGVQDHLNRYFVRIDPYKNDFDLYRYEAGNVIYIDGNSPDIQEDAWYRVEISWGVHGTHTLTLYDSSGTKLSQFSGSDSTWQSGGIGFDGYLSGEETVYYDHVAIDYSVVDNFEDGDISEYNGDTGAFTVQSNTVLEGTRTLKGMSASSTISHTGVETPRGYQYRARVLAVSGSGAKPALMTCIQNLSAPLDDCYYLALDPVNDSLSLHRRENGNDIVLQQTDVALEEGVEYQLLLEMQHDSISGAVLDADGNDLGEAGEHDVTYSDGYLGVHLRGGSPGHFDYLTKTPLGERILDSFEDGDLSEYAGDTAYYSIQSSTSLKGNSSLKCGNSYTSIGHTTTKTSRGNGYRCQFKAESGSGSMPGLLACVQDPKSPMRNCYWAKAEPQNDEFGIKRREGGSTTTLDSEAVTLEEGIEYQLEIQLLEGKIKVNLYTKNGVMLAETATIRDATYESGHFGFYTGGSGTPAYYDDVVEYPLSVDSSTEVSESKAEGQRALDSNLTQEVLSELNNPSTSPSNATRGNIYTDQQSLRASVVNVPIEYGKLHVVYKNGSVLSVRADLDRSTMPSSLIDDLSDNFGWDSSQEGVLVNRDDSTEVKFMREASDAERSDIKSYLSSSEGRDDEPGRMMVMNNNGGCYRAIYHDVVYDVNEQIDTVVQDEEIIQSPSQCTVENATCAASTTWSAAGTTLTAYTCGSALLSLGATAPACAASAVLNAGSYVFSAYSCIQAKQCNESN